MSSPVFASRGSLAPWDEPDVKDLWCSCGHSWEDHENPDGQDTCPHCKRTGVSDVPDPSVPFVDGEPQAYLACPLCDNGIVKTHCTDPDCDCTRFVERGARTLIGMSARQSAMLEQL